MINNTGQRAKSMEKRAKLRKANGEWKCFEPVL
jgi:hypothetical protein